MHDRSDNTNRASGGTQHPDGSDTAHESEPERGTDGGAGSQTQTDAGRTDSAPASTIGKLADRFTETLVRLTVAVIGIAILLLALSQIVGVNLYSIVGQIISSRIGQWVLVALFGLGLIVAAGKRWTSIGHRT